MVCDMECYWIYTTISCNLGKLSNRLIIVQVSVIVFNSI